MKKVGTVIRTSTPLTLLNIYGNINIEIKTKQYKLDKGGSETNDRND